MRAGPQPIRAFARKRDFVAQKRCAHGERKLHRETLKPRRPGCPGGRWRGLRQDMIHRAADAAPVGRFEQAGAKETSRGTVAEHEKRRFRVPAHLV